MSQTPWYAVRTATRQEHKVVEGLGELGYSPSDIFLPCERREYRLGRQKRIRDVPLLAGYLFLRADATELWKVEKVYGVYKVLSQSRHDGERQAARIDPGFIDGLRLLLDRGKFDRSKPAPRMDFAKGEQVKVIDGFLAGWVGEVLAAPRAHAVKIVVEMFGRAQHFEIQAADLESLDRAPVKAA